MSDPTERDAGRLSADEELAAAVDRLDRIVGSFEREPNANVRERVFELLEAVDAVHRPLVWRVGERIWRERQELFEALLEEPVASVLFEMYGLVSPKRREPEAPAGYVALEDLLRTVPEPFGWHRIARPDEIPAGALLVRSAAETRLILTRTGGGVRAYIDACPGTELGLSGGAVSDGVLTCPWHGCRFDLSSGSRSEGEGAALEAVPVEVAGDEVRVGLRVPTRSAA